MAFVNLFPIGVMQLRKSLTVGYFEARSPEFLAERWVNLLEWARLPGDVLFGAVFQAGSVSVMVSTDGGNPNAARWVRDEVERALGPLIGILGETMHTDDDQMTRRSYAQIDQQMKLEQAKGPTA